MTPYHDPHTATRRLERDEWMQREASRVELWEYLKPAIMLCVGFVGILLLFAMRGNGAAVEQMFVSAIVFPIMLVVQIVVGVTALMIVSALWVGGAGPLFLGVLRLAGICAITNLVAVFLGPLGCFALPAVAFVYAGLIAWLFDMEWVDGLAVAVISFVLIVAASFTMIAVFG